jgi:hypothetical protein
MKEQGRWEETVRRKLEAYEAEVAPEDWGAIAGRLPETPGRVIPFQVRRYAVALLALLLVSAGGYFYHRQRTRPAAGFAGTEQRETAKPDGSKPPSLPPAFAHLPLTAGASPQQRTRTAPPLLPPQGETPPVAEAAREQTILADTLAGETPPTPPLPPSTDEPSREPAGDNCLPTLLAEAPPEASKKRSPRRWSLGLGGGSYSTGANGGGNARNLPMGDYAMVYNPEAPPRPVLRSEERKQNLSHNYPLSFGLGVSYALNDRWALQSGLTYTLLRSEWITTASEYPGQARQQLHFIGLPLNMNYKIAEWNRFRFYATGGVLAEWNAGGQIRTDYLNGGQLIRTEKESARMKEWLWSVHTRVGASYPLVRFVSAYAEGGASYYFNNGSPVETIRSDKPFHLSLQAGIRFGF